MEVVGLWTGQTATALRMALRMTNENFGEHLGTSVRTVANWSAHPELVPVPELQRALDTALSHAPDEERARFAQLSSAQQEARRAAAALSGDMLDAVRWLDTRMGWPSGRARSRVVDLAGKLSEESFQDRRYRRNTVSRSALADRIFSYYKVPEDSDYGFYAVTLNGTQLATTILTKATWLNLACKIDSDRENLSLSIYPQNHDRTLSLDEAAAEQSIIRLAETLALGTRLVNARTYRLTDVSVSKDGVSGSLDTIQFVEYALTYDLMESEVLDAVTNKGVGDLPLRSRYLPDVDRLISPRGRTCVGGPVALTAIARNRGLQRDYVLLVQERSGNVLNASRRLSVIPKAFHQPLVDLSEDVNLAATIEREMAEELFGMPEFDLGGSAYKSVDPMRPGRLSEPMRWLLDHRNDEAWHVECTGFGMNAVSGNFEFASLVVISDSQWWDLYGGHIQGNWEVEGFRRYSSLDSGMLESLAADPSWSNEGLFAFIEGIRRLAELDSERVALPSLGVELKR